MQNNDIIPIWLKRFYLKHAPDAVKDPYIPTHWKEKVLYSFVLLSFTLGLAILIPSMYFNIQKQYWLISIAAMSGYLGCLLVFFLPRIPFEFRAFIACALIYFIGIAYIFSVGPFLATREWLFSFSIMASLLLGWTGAIVSISINLITWAIIGTLLNLGYWEDLLNLENATTYWHMIAVDLLFINIGTTLLITLFFARIEKSDRTAKTYSQLLQTEGIKLSEANKKLELEIEDRKAITKALQKSEEKYRTIIETIQDAYFEVDLDGNFTFFNKALSERLECDPNELIGMNYKMYMDKKNENKLRRIFRHIFITRKSSQLFDLETISKKDNVFTSSVLISLQLNNNSEPIGFQGIARDVTEQKQLEIQLRRAQKMEALGTLAGGVAHDLNNTLSGIINYPELLLSDMNDADPIRKPLSAIKLSGEKAAAMVQDLLTLARRGVSSKEAINVNTTILEYFQSTEFQTLKSFHPDVEIISRLEKKLLNICGSPVHLSKTIMNLVSNAAEAITGKGTITITTENRYVENSVNSYDKIEEGDYVVLTIRDTGDGIAPNDLDKIFEPFFTTKMMGRSGTGLGMAVVWGTVKDHGGSIDIKSTQGKGTTILLYFPVTREKVVRTAATVSIKDFKGNGESILVVDDVETQREIATAMLETLGYSVTSVKSGEEAIEFFRNNTVDLIVLDMIMRPGIDGLETYKRILQLHPGQKAVIASGYTETEQVKEAQKLGAGRYIRKPYSLESIGSAIRKGLGQK